MQARRSSARTLAWLFTSLLFVKEVTSDKPAIVMELPDCLDSGFLLLLNGQPRSPGERDSPEPSQQRVVGSYMTSRHIKGDSR